MARLPSPPRLGTEGVGERDRWRYGRGKVRPRRSLISHYTARSRLEVPDESLACDEPGRRLVNLGYPIDHLLPDAHATVVHRLKKRVEWTTRVR